MTEQRESRRFKKADTGGWPTHMNLQRLPGGITRSESVGFHQVLQIGEIGLILSLEHAHQERLRQLEEAARFPDQGERDPCAALTALEGHPVLHGERPRLALLGEAVIRLELGKLGFSLNPPTQKREDGTVD